MPMPDFSKFPVMDFSNFEVNLWNHQKKMLDYMQAYGTGPASLKALAVKHLDSNVWTCNDGRKIPIKDLTDGHLLNIARLLNRRAKEFIAGRLKCAMSTINLEVEFCNELAEKISKDLIPKFNNGPEILAECVRRGYKDFEHTFVFETAKTVSVEGVGIRKVNVGSKVTVRTK